MATEMQSLYQIEIKIQQICKALQKVVVGLGYKSYILNGFLPFFFWTKISAGLKYARFIFVCLASLPSKVDPLNTWHNFTNAHRLVISIDFWALLHPSLIPSFCIV